MGALHSVWSFHHCKEGKTIEKEEMLQDAVLYVHRTHIFIDTCSLLSEYSEAFWNRWIPTLRKSGQKVIIIPSVLNELMRHRDNRKDRKLARKADNVLRLLQLLEKENLVVLAGVEESNYADADFEKIMACASRKQPMMLITQDRELAAKIHHLKNHHAMAARLAEGGILLKAKPERKEPLLTRIWQGVCSLFGKEKDDRASETCRLCGKSWPAYRMKAHICPECLKKGTIHHCKRCGKDMLYTNYLKYVEKAEPFAYCDDCYRFRKKVFQYRTCQDCGCTFPVTQGEAEFYQGKGYDLPKRCRDCRHRRR